KTHTVAEMFGAGARASGSSALLKRTKDGSLDGCVKADPSNDKPPSQCAAVIRLDLVGIDEAGPVAPQTKEAPAEQVCPRGTVLAGGKCTTNREIAHSCAPADLQDCTAQCSLNDGASCVNLGIMYVTGNGVARDSAKAVELYRRACD